MPRKLGVGMPKRKKSKVPAVPATAAAPAAAPAVAVAEEPASASSKRRSATSLVCAPPPSPGAVKQKLLKAAVRKAQEAVRGKSKGMKQSWADLVLARKIYSSRLDSIGRAQSRKRNPLAPHKVMDKLWKADANWKDAQLLHHAGQTLLAEETVKLRDAQIALLRFQLRRKSRRGRVGRVLGLV